MVLLQKTRQYIIEQQLIEVGDKVLVAVSAGKDSCVLLDILSRLRDDNQFRIGRCPF